jgi:hypothetical protein
MFQRSLVPPHLGNKLLGDVGKYLPTNMASYPRILESSSCDYYNTTQEMYLQHYIRHYMEVSGYLHALYTFSLEKKPTVPIG